VSVFGSIKNALWVDEIYRGYLKEPLPAQTAIGVSALSLGSRVEVVVIAKK
jgi:enamine deaminase RidA (YjgF/YER057c/UK114 family)